VVVCAPGGLVAASVATCPAVEDLDGTLLALWAGREGAVGLVRPDRFLAAVAGEAQLAAAFRRLTGQPVLARTCTPVQAP
jgi:hypothetical protein